MAEPVRAKKIARRPSRGMGTPSIKRALRGEFNDEEKKISAKEQFAMFSKADEEEPFTLEELMEKWNAYLPRLQDRPSIKATLSTKPKIQEDYTLLLEIDNRIQDELLMDVKTELVSYLRKELKNSKITLKTLITEVKHEKVIYSDVEKYQAMASKNPHLATLKRSLNMDF